jgi:2-polyprenyl-3-methyl-5-hydroxy-6-metoxy-1,4-benzoquinol methylase
MTTNTPRYSFNNGSAHAVDQMRCLAEVLDETTRRHLRQSGDLKGARCLDIGAGSGTISAWLAEAVGPDGNVTATDLDPRHLHHLKDTVSVLRHDIRTDPIPAFYDLIHARLVLLHLPERVAIVKRLAKALRPHGRLVITEWQSAADDLVLRSRKPADAELFTRFNAAFVQSLIGNGADNNWATQVSPVMRDAGLVDVAVHTDTQPWAGGTAGCLLLYSNSYHLEPALRAAGLTGEDLDGVRTLLTDPDFVIGGYLSHTTIGRAPEWAEH